MQKRRVNAPSRQHVKDRNIVSYDHRPQAPAWAEVELTVPKNWTCRKEDVYIVTGRCLERISGLTVAQQQTSLGGESQPSLVATVQTRMARTAPDSGFAGRI